MAWLINTTATPVLTIGGVNYSANFLDFRVSDASVLGTGIITTQGSLTLAELPGQTTLLDYGKTKFQRGTSVTLDLVIAGVTRRHPRGTLLILDSAYDTENRTTQIDVGCLLTFYGITDNITSLRSQTVFTLPEDAKFSDLSNALQAERMFLWVNKNGQIEKRSFFGSDGLGSNLEAAAFVSVRDHTAINCNPLGGGNLVPDTVRLTYTWLENATGEYEPPATDETGTRYEENISESSYFLEHPANLKQTATVCSTDAAGVRTCETKETWDGKRTFAVKKTTTDRNYYGATGGSTSQQVSWTIGPAVELNGSYYAELYSWEVARNSGDPAGISLKGLENVTQESQEKLYEYGSGGEVVRTIDRRYRNLLNAMNQRDWRASETTQYGSYSPTGSTVGSPTRAFLTDPPTGQFYLQQQVTTTWQYLDDRTIEETVTLTSAADCNETGIYEKEGPRTLIELDADKNGIETREKRTSMSGLANPTQPDRIGDGEPGKVTKSNFVENVSQRYPITAAGSVVQEMQLPFQVNEYTEAQARTLAINFATYYRDLLEGDSAGVRVSEAMRPELFNYYPGMPFAFYDRTVQKVLRLRMNGTGWGVSATDALVVTDGLFIGESNGTVNIGSNV